MTSLVEDDHALAEELSQRQKRVGMNTIIELTREDWNKFEIKSLHSGHFVRMGKEYYVPVVEREQTRLPLRSQWQLVVWMRQALLFLISFAMDCFVWFAPTDIHGSMRYVFASFAVVFLGGFWWLQVKRKPYARLTQQYLESFLFFVDILAMIGACVYGALTRDGEVQGADGRLQLELALGGLLCASVLIAIIVILHDINYERRLINSLYSEHGLGKEQSEIIDEPLRLAIRDGAIRIIDCGWLMDSHRSDPQLPHITRVEVHLSVDAGSFGLGERRRLIRTLAAHCKVSPVCITLEEEDPDQGQLQPHQPESAKLYA